ncbi:MAG: sigma-E factor negative regulatory protein [Wenzhouxiangellaceae bacterium]|nr:sigma-E factor negative regulatory protein [Wenzhouxiangellaceae bacterium]
MDANDTPESQPNPDPSLERMSALADGELDRESTDFLLRRTAGDDGLRRRWDRIHMVRACLQREYPGRVDLVGAVRDAVASEAMEAAPGRGRLPALARYGLGGAMAAGVAALAVIGLGHRVDSVPEPASEPVAGFVSQTTALDRQFSREAVPAGFVAGRDLRPAQSQTPEYRQRLDRYLIQHGQATSASGFVSFTPILTMPRTEEAEEPLSPVVSDD